MMTNAGSLRLLVETDEGGSAGELALRDAVAALAGGGGVPWLIERLFPDDEELDRHFVVSMQPTVPVTPQQAFALAYRLADEPGVHQAEPDLPVPAYAPGDDDDDEDELAAVGAFEAAPPSQADLDWARKAIRCDEAWALPPKPGGAARGEGIRIGHPDTGYTRHWALGADLATVLDLVHDRDFVKGDDNAEDPLDSGLPLTKFPAHGTGTSSVIVGRGDPATGIVGVAPAATLVPLRAVNSVIQLFDSDVAKAVNHARKAGCHVVSMSLGGKGFFGLHDAIQRAVDSGMIVMAAAGNHVRIVTAPASYDNCIAVAATTRDDSTWSGSSRGGKVEIAAPGSGVYGAAWALKEDPKVAFVSTKHGTSYAVAHLAGAAALWLAHHGRTTLLGAYPGGLLAAAFRRTLRDHGHRPPSTGTWDSSKYGVGILDVCKLLEAPLPDKVALQAEVGAFAPSPPTGVQRIAASFGELSESDVEKRMAALGLPDEELERFSSEILYHLLVDDRAADAFVEEPDAGGVGAFGPSWVGRIDARASGRLAAALS